MKRYQREVENLRKKIIGFDEDDYFCLMEEKDQYYKDHKKLLAFAYKLSMAKWLNIASGDMDRDEISAETCGLCLYGNYYASQNWGCKNCLGLGWGSHCCPEWLKYRCNRTKKNAIAVYKKIEQRYLEVFSK